LSSAFKLRLRYAADAGERPPLAVAVGAGAGGGEAAGGAGLGRTVASVETLLVAEPVLGLTAALPPPQPASSKTKPAASKTRRTVSMFNDI